MIYTIYIASYLHVKVNGYSDIQQARGEQGRWDKLCIRAPSAVEAAKLFSEFSIYFRRINGVDSLTFWRF